MTSRRPLDVSRRDEDELGLPAVEVLDAVGGQRDALLQRHPHALPAPLRHRPAHREFERVDGVGVDGVVAGPRHAVLRVPLADRRAGAVAVERRPGGSRRRRRCPPRPRPRAAAASTSLPVRPDGERRRRQVLHAVAGAQRRAQPVGRRRLAGAQHVAVALGVGLQARGWPARRRSARGRRARSPRRRGRRAAACRAPRPAAPRPAAGHRRLEPRLDARGRGSAAGSTRRRRAPSSSPAG